ncbi:MAG TPA: hypothetical protein DCS93_26685 [Microscillaceae bacterium]|nr:hypothetical protein [Microscillaceae bacterium]
MEFIQAQLGKLGAFLFFFGLASALLSFFNYNLRLLLWVDLWGTTMGWIIRISFIVGGGLLFLLFGRSDDD